MAENTASDTERRGCLLAKGAAELAQHDPTVAGRSDETMRALLTLLRTEISAAQRHGDIDSAADPERLAALLLTVVRGIEAVARPAWTRRRCGTLQTPHWRSCPCPRGRNASQPGAVRPARTNLVPSRPHVRRTVPSQQRLHRAQVLVPKPPSSNPEGCQYSDQAAELGLSCGW
ncbi:TetR family transcriptional regulator C-terminal domain-containing protein [Streptomyces sp. NEAU-YJ-81]|uniref:TetR family transcriptional regulator C-terminal domain-containing protein n=1 Tax=Streptomyces sp. NEAU-YJ-81 TaxID=2820288 RepID=UPI0035ADDCB9